jgi:hypothetical protein
MKLKIFYFAFLFLLTGCNKEDDSLPEAKQTILFQREYINYAWGYRQDGWIIDSSGNFRTFQMPKVWNFVDSLGLISSDDMNENIQQTDSILFKIEKDTILKYFSKLKKASEGKMSEPHQEMFDAGVTYFSGYIYEPCSKKFKQVLLRQTGDIFIENKSKEADEIFNWMISLDPKN